MRNRVLVVIFFMIWIVGQPLFANQYEKLIQKGQFKQALSFIKSDRNMNRTRKAQNDIRLLEAIVPVFGKFSNELAAQQKAKVITRNQQLLLNRIMIKSVLLILDNKIELAKAYLIQGLYFHASPAFKTLLSQLGFPEGSYLIFDQRDAKLSQADQFFYGGAYMKALDNLVFLSDVDESNALVFEKLGSCYYMMNQKQQAVDKWQTALFLNPKKRQLRPLITHVKKQIEDEAKQRYIAQKNRQSRKKVRISDPLSMGVFRTRGAANAFAQQYIEKKIPAEVIQREDQRWQVQVSKKALQASQKGNK